ncbi:MAG: YggS family pyridoxal phosphate-dependent enzyme [Flavobacteriaceae bacterium]|nr:YggS family pyridoxal phosphate-dependent enzyme [Flavobacteriaceae bacterium]
MIAENLNAFRSALPDQVTLVAVSKTKPIEALKEAYDAGQLDFGENKVQELCMKAEALPKDIRWHMIGHLQRNKVKYIAPFVGLIHSVDSLRLLQEINKQAAKNNRIIDCLLQIRIADESTKFGMNYDEAILIIENEKLPNVSIKGLMGMASFTENRSQIQDEFVKLHTFYQEYRSTEQWDTLSMGMSGDFQLAIDSGSNMIRVGSRIFGARN